MMNSPGTRPVSKTSKAGRSHVLHSRQKISFLSFTKHISTDEGALMIHLVTQRDVFPRHTGGQSSLFCSTDSTVHSKFISCVHIDIRFSH